MSTVEWLIAICLIGLLISLGASLYAVEKVPVEPVEHSRLMRLECAPKDVKAPEGPWLCLKSPAPSLPSRN